MKLINQFSFVFVAVLVLGAFGFFTLRGGFSISRLVFLGAILLLSILAFVLFTPGTSTLDEADHVEAHIGGGSPVLLEFQSPY